MYEYYDECSPLTSAIKNGNEKIVKLLLTNDNIDVNSVSKNIYKENKDTNCSIYSFKSYTQVIEHNIPIGCAVMMNNSDITKLLLEHNNINLSANYLLLTIKRNIIFDNFSIFYLFQSLFCIPKKISVLNIAMDNNVANVKLLLEKSPVEVIENSYLYLQKLIEYTSQNNNDQTDDDSNMKLDRLNEISELFQKYINRNTKNTSEIQ